MKLMAIFGVVAALFTTQAYSYETPDLNNGMWGAKWGSSLQNLGPHYYVADASNLIYQVSHISEQCYVKQEESQTDMDIRIYCYKNDKFTTTLEFQKGHGAYQNAKDAYQPIAVNPNASVVKDMLDEYVSYQVPTTKYGQLMVTVSYSKPKDMSLVIINNLAILKQNVNEEEKPYLQK
jgi:hypothetical protein